VHGKQPLELVVPALLQAPGFGRVNAAMAGLPVMQRRFKDAMRAHQIRGLHARLMLAQTRDDPLFREPFPRHLSAFQRAALSITVEKKTKWQVKRRSADPGFF